MDNYYEKYLKYKGKYLQLKKQKGGTNDVVINYIRGCLYGGAIGDTMGLFTEFMTKDELKTRYSENQLSKPFDYKKRHTDLRHRANWEIGDWTDDTDQTICILDTIVEIMTDDVPKKENALALNISKWIEFGFKECGDKFGGIGVGSATKEWCVNTFKKRVGVLNPYFESVKVYITNEKFPCNLQPNGAVMRTCIVGTWHYSNLSKVFDDAIWMCKITHASPKCVASCMFISGLVSYLVKREKYILSKEEKIVIIEEIIKNMNEKLEKYNEEFEKEIQKVIKENPTLDLTNCKKYNVEEIIEEMKSYIYASSVDDLKLGKEIGYTFKPVGCATYCFLNTDISTPTEDVTEGVTEDVTEDAKNNDFESLIIKILKEGGDADTNCVVVGGVLGAYYGFDYIKDNHNYLLDFKYKTFLDNKVSKYIEAVFLDDY